MVYVNLQLLLNGTNLVFELDGILRTIVVEDGHVFLFSRPGLRPVR